MERDQASKFMFDLLRLMVSKKGSDLFITAGFPPAIKIDGKMTPVSAQALTPAHTADLARSIMNDKQTASFEQTKEANFAISPGDLGRFRVSAFVQMSCVGMVLRTINSSIPEFDDLGLPPVLKDVIMSKRGLVIMVGATGSGKSTTLASMVDMINEERHEHILTIEDPIEFLHNHKSCVVNQREVAADTHSFASALRTALRQDPDVVLVGEMRDLETIEMALRIAETGHLTFATLHTNSAYSTINRIIDVFPSGQQSQIRTQLSLVLEGIMCQALLPKASGDGRVMALEILVPNAAIRNLIREDKIHQIYSMMQTGQDKFGMQTFNQALASLYHKRQITLEAAMQRSSNADELKELIERGSGLNETYTGQTKPVAPGAHASPYAAGRPVGSRPPVR